MAIYFSNSGNIELDTIRTMGVSVKDNDNPIGYFGTGIKYAIATLLRTGHIVSLRTNGETIQFRTREKEIRGKTFNMIYMDDEQLGFTTDLGRDWEVWQAYRELYSNCIDEGGTISGVLVDNDTIFTVEGPDIANVHAERAKIFLHGDPWLIGDGIEVHRGKSEYLYYRGVRVHKLPKVSRFTYNFTCAMKLTEDRTLASPYDANYKLNTRLPMMTDIEFCTKVIDPKYDVYEKHLNFSEAYDPSEEFLDALEPHVNNMTMSENNRNLVRKKRKVEEFAYFSPRYEDLTMIQEACDLLKHLNVKINPSELIYVEHLGPSVIAMAKDGKMYLTRQALANGKDFVAITIYEEWIHNKLGYTDCSRGMQQYLFDKILELVKEKDEK